MFDETGLMIELYCEYVSDWCVDCVCRNQVVVGLVPAAVI